MSCYLFASAEQNCGVTNNEGDKLVASLFWRLREMTLGGDRTGTRIPRVDRMSPTPSRTSLAKPPPFEATSEVSSEVFLRES